MNRHGFCDLCIPYTPDHRVLSNIINELVDVGYKNLAIEQIYDDLETLNKDKKQDVIPAPVVLDFIKEKYPSLKILSRLTIIFSDNSISHLTGKSTNFKKFDIVAVLPVNEESLNYACQTFNCDIITFNTKTVKIKPLRKFYSLAVSRNVYFEIKYAPAVTDSCERKAIITKCHQLHYLGKSRNIIISSGATRSLECRGPYDVANLGLIFGLTEDQAKSSILSLGLKVILRAEGRRFGKTIISLNDKPSKDDYYDESSSEFEEDNSIDQKEPNSKKQKIR